MDIIRGLVNYREAGGETARCWQCPFLYGATEPVFNHEVCTHPEWHETIVVDGRPHDECLNSLENLKEIK